VSQGFIKKQHFCFYTQGSKISMPLLLDISLITTSQAPPSYLLYRLEIIDTFCAHIYGPQNKKELREKSKPTNIFDSFIIITNKKSPAKSLTNSNKKRREQSIWYFIY
jgi:hypothetical protein